MLVVSPGHGKEMLVRMHSCISRLCYRICDYNSVPHHGASRLLSWGNRSADRIIVYSQSSRFSSRYSV